VFKKYFIEGFTNIQKVVGFILEKVVFVKQALDLGGKTKKGTL
jgi:hypothetical protein